MSRVAAADRIIDPAEVDQMRRSLIDEGGLPMEQAELVVSLATAEAKEYDGSQITSSLADWRN